MGLVKKDYIADLILLNKNPLEDIGNTKYIQAVIKDGNFLDRNTMDEIQKEISAGVAVSALSK